ncbi:MAG: nodulation factor ABC transporter ATP-binding protein NodI [Burkholderiaceae bacterium]|nr:nodulation factor ABC transporter ATP-binding protein NodI [Burkholderiaceae bacterium]
MMIASRSTENAALIADNVRKRYGEKVVVDGLTFSIARGECYGLLGPNGAGKTTTLRTLLGLTPYDSGKIRVLEHPIPHAARQARMRIGVVPQMDNLDPDFTVSENLWVFGRYFGMSTAQARARVPELLAFATLESKADARIGELSGGMKRRLTLARAMINDPDLIIMDEPTTGLDPQARHLIWERLKALLARGKTILLTTHFMDEAERLCHRLGLLDQGRLMAEGTPRALIDAHVEPQVLEVYGDGLVQWLSRHRDSVHARIEVSGETAFCYTEDATPLLADIQGRDDLRYLHRPANLEDLFLRLTGRGMREGT